MTALLKFLKLICMTLNRMRTFRAQRYFMHLPTSKVLLDKVNTLFQQAAMGKGSMSAMERDLMLDYLRQLYDQVLQAKTDATLATPAPTTPATPAAKPATPPPPPPPVRNAPPTPTAPPPVAPPPPAPVMPPPAPFVPQPAPVVEIHVPEPVVPEPAKPTPTPEPEQPKAAPATRVDAPAAVLALFSTKRSGELSDKLSTMPIKEIKKGLSINDRMVIVADLFGGSGELFERHIGLTQEALSFEEASQSLLSAAVAHNWADDEKKPTALILINAVRRRFV
jgi:hypothetical protein